MDWRHVWMALETSFLVANFERHIIRERLLKATFKLHRSSDCHYAPKPNYCRVVSNIYNDLRSTLIYLLLYCDVSVPRQFSANRRESRFSSSGQCLVISGFPLLWSQYWVSEILSGKCKRRKIAFLALVRSGQKPSTFHANCELAKYNTDAWSGE